MNYLFVHQNFPGQFKHIASHLSRQDGNKVVFITQNPPVKSAGIEVRSYKPHRTPSDKVHPYSRTLEQAVIAGQGSARTAIELRDSGFQPDLIVAHPGWGETLFLKDVFPGVPILSYCEFYYHGHGADVNFDPEFPSDFDTLCRLRIRNAHHLLALELADQGVSPTNWQKSQFPAALADKIDVVHDGIDCEKVCPNPNAQVRLPDETVLRAGDEVLVFIARNLELYRGFHIFMRSLPELLSLRPEAQVIIVGGDDAGYGRAAPEGATWRETLLSEVGPLTDRVHFVGRLPYAQYLKVQQVAAARIYLSYPFVLSWSLLESMAAGCLVIGSRTPPVEEVIQDGVNGRLVDFFDASAIARTTAEVLDQRKSLDNMRSAARQTILDQYDWRDCRQRLLGLMSQMIS